MRNILALVGLAVVVFLGVGYARGWYSFEVNTGRDGKVRVEGDVDLRKVKADGEVAKEKAGDAIDSFRNKNGSTAPAATLPLPK